MPNVMAARFDNGFDNRGSNPLSNRLYNPV